MLLIRAFGSINENDTPHKINQAFAFVGLILTIQSRADFDFRSRDRLDMFVERLRWREALIQEP